jgi:lipid-A-disaccharide synthase-like uncharacterized protein
MRILKAGVLYFAMVFGVGFILGPIRILWVVPHLGTRTAELLEMLIMLAVIIFAARYVVRWLNVPYTPFSRMGMGFLALALLIGGELLLALPARGLSLTDYLAARDPISGTAYFVMLQVCGLMPLLVHRR